MNLVAAAAVIVVVVVVAIADDYSKVAVVWQPNSVEESFPSLHCTAH